MANHSWIDAIKGFCQTQNEENKEQLGFKSIVFKMHHRRCLRKIKNQSIVHLIDHLLVVLPDKLREEGTDNEIAIVQITKTNLEM